MNKDKEHKGQQPVAVLLPSGGGKQAEGAPAATSVFLSSTEGTIADEERLVSYSHKTL